MVVALGGRSTSDRHQMGGLPTGQCLAMALLPLVVQHSLQSAFQVQLSDTDRRIAADVEGVAQLGIGPAFGRFEQDPSAGKGTCVGLACMDECLQGGTIGFGQCNRNGMLQAGLLVFP